MHKFVKIIFLFISFFEYIQTSSFFFETSRHTVASIGLTLGAGGFGFAAYNLFCTQVPKEFSSMVNKIQAYEEILKEIEKNEKKR